jgi:hypothetical protein
VPVAGRVANHPLLRRIEPDHRVVAVAIEYLAVDPELDLLRVDRRASLERETAMLIDIDHREILDRQQRRR